MKLEILNGCADSDAGFAQVSQADRQQPRMPVIRAKLKSRRDDLIIARGKLGGRPQEPGATPGKASPSFISLSSTLSAEASAKADGGEGWGEEALPATSNAITCKTNQPLQATSMLTLKRNSHACFDKPTQAEHVTNISRVTIRIV